MTTLHLHPSEDPESLRTALVHAEQGLYALMMMGHPEPMTDRSLKTIRRFIREIDRQTNDTVRKEENSSRSNAV